MSKFSGYSEPQKRRSRPSSRKSQRSRTPRGTRRNYAKGLKYNKMFVQDMRPTVDPRLHENFRSKNMLTCIKTALLSKCGKGTGPTRTYWKFFNRDCRKGVDFGEFVEALHDLNLFYPKKDVRNLFDTVLDVNGDGHIDWSEFCQHFYAPDFTDEGTVRLGTKGFSADDLQLQRQQKKKSMRRCKSARSLRAPYANRDHHWD